MIQEKDYEIVPTADGTLIFAISPRNDEPQNPFMMYDGGEHAKFYRRPSEIVLLDYINPGAKEPLLKAEFVIMTEVDYSQEKVVRDYKVKVRIVEKLQAPENMETI